MIFFLRVSVKNRNPYLKTSARRCCAGAFNSGVKGLKLYKPLALPDLLYGSKIWIMEGTKTNNMH
jgi:hypothetical protein